MTDDITSMMSPVAERATPAARPFRVLDLGRMAYAPALEVQRRTHGEVLDGRAPPTLLLVEHDPVITISRRKNAGRNLVAPAAQLAALGIDVQPTDRGGDVTYHGPGQLVAYPIIHLPTLGLSIGAYMRLLEEVVIQTVAAFGVAARRETGFTGVWALAPGVTPGPGWASSSANPELGTRNSELPPAPGFAPPSRKLAALGVRVSRGVTMHGLALNVTTDLSHFDTIVPCGLVGRGVTSLREILGPSGGGAPTMPAVKAELMKVFERLLAGKNAAAAAVGAAGVTPRSGAD